MILNFSCILGVKELLYTQCVCKHSLYTEEVLLLVAVMLETHYYLREMVTKSNNLHFISPLVCSTLTSEVVIKSQAIEELAELSGQRQNASSVQCLFLDEL